MPTGAALGTDKGCGRVFGWARMDVNREDPVEMALVADLQRSTLAHVADSSCKTYTCQFNLFVEWCGALTEPRVPLPASDATVALYLQSVANAAKPFAPVKAASSAIAIYQKISLFTHELTQSPVVCIVRSAAMRRFGLNTVNQNEHFKWEQVARLAEAYGV